MCGYADAKINGNKADIGLGYYGGSLEVGKLSVYNKSSQEEFDAMRKHLITYKKDELAALMLDWVRNAEEG